VAAAGSGIELCACCCCRQWVSKNIPLLLDKNPNVRQMAAKALATIYSMDPHTVSAGTTSCWCQPVQFTLKTSSS
jgi:hypothetical protein